MQEDSHMGLFVHTGTPHKSWNHDGHPSDEHSPPVSEHSSPSYSCASVLDDSNPRSSEQHLRRSSGSDYLVDELWQSRAVLGVIND